jgi:hypothetical protein
MKSFSVALLLLLSLALSANAQEQSTKKETSFSGMPNKQIGLGVGGGLEYGGFGLNVIAYPDPHFGLFLGVGYAIAGPGYNLGMKFMLCSDQPKHRTLGFAQLMYGYNAGVVVTNASKFNKVFYGPSMGLGVDIHSRKHPTNCWSFGINLPYRSQKIDSYIEELKLEQGFEENYNPLPVTFSVGIRF